MVSETKETARGQYKRKECPYCHEHVGNLPNHIRLKHPTESPAEAPAPAELTKAEILAGKAGTQDPAPDQGAGDAPAQVQGNTSFCHVCPDGKRAEVRKNETECWRCGSPLEWGGIE